MQNFLLKERVFDYVIHKTLELQHYLKAIVINL